MPFEAGSILGHLGLDISDYEGGILKAEGISEIFGPEISTFLADPMLGVIETAKEMASSYVEALGEMQQETLNLGLAAEKAGTSVSFMSEWQDVAKATGVSADALGSGFKLLEKNASDAAEQGGTMLKYWNELGISQQDLQAHLGDTAGLFMMVKDHLDQVGSAAEKAALAQNLFGRGGAELIPIFDQSDEAINKIIDTAQKMGAVETDSAVEAARAMQQLQTGFDDAWEGIKKAALEPVLDYFGQHSQQILDAIIPDIQAVENALSETFKFVLDENGPQMLALVQDIAAVLPAVATVMEGIVGTVSWFVSNAGTIMEVLGGILAVVNPLAGAALLIGGAGLNALTAPDKASGGDTFITNVNPPSADETSNKFGQKVLPMIKQSQSKHAQQTAAAAAKRTSALAIGGLL